MIEIRGTGVKIGIILEQNCKEARQEKKRY